MGSNYKANGTDLDDIFMAGSGAGGTNYNVSGSDLNSRYQAIGSTSKVGDVGYRVNGTDISNYFMAKHNCYTYEVYRGPGGNASASWTTCYGGFGYDVSDTDDPGYAGTYAFTTSCAWEGTVNTYDGSYTANPSGCS